MPARFRRARPRGEPTGPRRLADEPAVETAPPASATSFAVSLLALLVGLALVWAMAPGHHPALPGGWAYVPLIPCLGIFAVMAAAECGAGYRAGTGFFAQATGLIRWRRVAVRVTGFVATLALVAAVYWLLPEYHGAFYAPYWRFLETIAPFSLLVPIYFAWVDTRVPLAHDEYHAFGSLVLHPRRAADGCQVRRHLMGWTVKAFFLPLMTVYLGSELDALYGALAHAGPAVMPLYQVFYHLSYTVDLLYCVVGYSATIRLFDSQIRSVEPTVAGWLVALLCYQPFYSVIGRVYLQYDDAVFWDNWLQPWPVVQALWAAVIVGLVSIYALCTVAFGLRFSNLTHRGIVTGGPYRFSKHPAYLAKNLSWYLISVPFISHEGFAAGLRNCCLLALLNLVYYLRARTEERHLSQDPRYVAYALWMNEHGLLRRLARVIPAIRYRAPAPPGAPGPRAAPDARGSRNPRR